MGIKNNLYLFGVCSLFLFAFQNCGNKLPEQNLNQSSNNNTNNTNNGEVIPITPNQLGLVAVSSIQINLTWIDSSTNESGFRIERAFSNAGPFSSGTGPGSFSVVGTVSANSQTYSDLNLTANTVYYYRVTAFNSAGSSLPSGVMNVSTPSAPANAPVAPSNLQASAIAPSLVNLSWLDNSNNESSFYIERSSDNGSTFRVIAVIAANVLNYQDYNLIEQTTYIYRARAVNQAGSSANTSNVSVSTPAATNKATFNYIMTNIIRPNCTECHGSTKADRGIRLDTYNGVLSIVSVNNANGSRLIQETSAGRMPPGAPLSTDQINSLRNWINAGALNN